MDAKPRYRAQIHTIRTTGNGERAPEDIEAAEVAGERTQGSIDGDYEALVRLLKENEELKDRALRIAAEMENLRRRTARDVHDARTYAVANFARDMLSVSDNLRRALLAPSAYLMKSPPEQWSDEVARTRLGQFIDGDA